jgi:hypothetical protein
MDHSCTTCGQPVVRLNDQKPWPQKCAACHLAAKRAYARQYREKHRKRIDWSAWRCRRCGSHECRVPRRGRPSKWCSACLVKVRNEQEKLRKSRAKTEGRDKIHACKCHNCESHFMATSSEHKFCSPECRHKGRKRRAPVPCECCGKSVRKWRPASSRHFCSKSCWLLFHSAPKVACVACGEMFKRKAYKSEWQGKTNTVPANATSIIAGARIGLDKHPCLR